MADARRRKRACGGGLSLLLGAHGDSAPRASSSFEAANKAFVEKLRLSKYHKGAVFIDLEPREPSPAPAPSAAGSLESSPAFAVLGVGAAAMALVGVGRVAVLRRYAGKEGHVLPSWRSLGGERSYRRLASEEAEEPGAGAMPTP